MALKGTIRDFGIADIFQLISQQTKTGVLILRDGGDDVRVSFREGAVVRVDSNTRPKHMLLGNMLVNSGLIPRDALDSALKEQARTLERIGTILVGLGAVKKEEVNETVRLQMTETLSRLFLWETGTYEFEQTDVPAPTDGAPSIRSENILMEGLRMVDEWPSVRRRLPAYGAVFETVRRLPAPKDETDIDLGEMQGFGVEEDKSTDDLGPPERRVYGLIQPGRTLQQLINLSRLGEFETCRAVVNLMTTGYIRELDLQSVEVSLEEPRRFFDFSVGNVFLRAAVYTLLGVLFVVLLRTADPEVIGDGALRVRRSAIEHHVAAAHLRVLERAVEAYRLSYGHYPDRLEELVEADLIRERDLSWPFETPYSYARAGSSFELAAPYY